MDLTNLLLSLGIVAGLILVSYQLGLRRGQRAVSQYLGMTHREALKRIKRQSDRNQ